MTTRSTFTEKAFKEKNKAANVRVNAGQGKKWMAMISTTNKKKTATSVILLCSVAKGK